MVAIPMKCLRFLCENKSIMTVSIYVTIVFMLQDKAIQTAEATVPVMNTTDMAICQSIRIRPVM